MPFQPILDHAHQEPPGEAEGCRRLGGIDERSARVFGWRPAANAIQIAFDAGADGRHLVAFPPLAVIVPGLREDPAELPRTLDTDQGLELLVELVLEVGLLFEEMVQAIPLDLGCSDLPLARAVLRVGDLCRGGAVRRLEKSSHHVLGVQILGQRSGSQRFWQSHGSPLIRSYNRSCGLTTSAPWRRLFASCPRIASPECGDDLSNLHRCAIGGFLELEGSGVRVYFAGSR